MLEVFKQYVLFFQRNEPSAHLLHEAQINLTRDFLGYFVKPECLPSTLQGLIELQIDQETITVMSKIFMGTQTTQVYRNIFLKI